MSDVFIHAHNKKLLVIEQHLQRKTSYILVETVSLCFIFMLTHSLQKSLFLL